MTAPRNLDELRSVKDPVAQGLAAKAYIEAREEAIREARRIRDTAIRTYLENHGAAATARAFEVSLALVKAVRR